MHCLSTAGDYQEIISMRHHGINANPELRRLGIIFSLHHENSELQSQKMGGLTVESSNAWANTQDMFFWVSNEKRMTIKNNGFVGVGTENPLARLHVFGNSMLESTGSNTFTFLTTSSTESFQYLEFLQGGTDLVQNRRGWIGMSPTNELVIKKENGGSILLDGAQVLVNNTLKAKEIIVQTNVWADHVFSGDYKLTALSEVESFINKNGHLPGIPS